MRKKYISDNTPPSKTSLWTKHFVHMTLSMFSASTSFSTEETHTQSPQQVTRKKGNSVSSCFRVDSLWAAAQKVMRHLKPVLVVCNHRGTLTCNGSLSPCKDQLLDLHIWSVSLETGSETQLFKLAVFSQMVTYWLHSQFGAYVSYFEIIIQSGLVTPS